MKGAEACQGDSVSLSGQVAVCVRLGKTLLPVVWGVAVIYLLLSVAETGLRLVTGQLFGKITNVLQGSANADGWVSSTYVYWVMAAIGSIVLPFFLKQATAVMDGRMVNRLRDNLFSRLLDQTSDFFPRNDPGRLSMIVNQMSLETQMIIRQLVVDPVVQLLSMILSASFIVANLLLVQDGKGNPYMWAGVGLVFIFAFFSPWMVSRLSSRLQKAATALRDENMALAGLVNGALQSPEEIQSFQTEPMLAGKHRGLLDRILTARLKQILNVQLLNSIDAVPLLAVQTGLVGFAIFGGVTRDGANPALAGAVVAILLQAPMLMAPIQAFSTYISMLRLYWPSIETVTSVLNGESASKDGPEARDVETVSPKFSVENLSFSYGPGLPDVFRGLTFEAPPGKITALVAKMGGGKTTLFRLALRFGVPAGGRINLGGHSPEEFTLSTLRLHAVMMSQFPAWFHESLRENMRIAKPGASDEDIRKACERTGMWDLLVNKIGANPLDQPFAAGRMLSGGQKKLLALSRCLLRDPMFLFLDEPTAGMDNREKYRLVDPIRKACEGKTVIIVDHDIPWLMRMCDHFVVLDGGRVVQQGGLSELLHEGGLFRELAMLPAEPLVPLLTVLQSEGMLTDFIQFSPAEKWTGEEETGNTPASSGVKKGGIN